MPARLPLVRSLLLTLALLPACASSPRPLGAVELSSLRSASSGTRPQTWVVRGTYRDAAGEGEFLDRFAADGRFAREHRSTLPGGSGFDGRRHWALPLDGLARGSGGRSAREAAVIAGLLSGAWLEASSNIVVGALGSHTYDLSLGGHSVATLEVDPSTHLPRRLALHRSLGKRELVLGDWRRRLGFPVAHEVVLSNGGGRVASWQVQGVVAEPASFTAPTSPEDHRFDEAKADVPARRVGVRMAVSMRCDDAGETWWLVDTGAASSAVSAGLAEELAWPALGTATVVGAGGRSAQGLRRSGTLRLGGLVVTGLPVIEADLEPLSSLLGLPIEGIVGADILARTVLELDLRSARARVIEPSHWSPPEEAVRVILDGPVPFLEARFAPDHTGLLRLDTGSDDTLIFHGPAVRRLGLTHRREDLVTVRVRGLGGEVLGDRGLHPWLEVAGQSFTRFPATYLRHSGGGLARDDVAGNLGAGLLAGHRVVLALPHECIVVD